jgi:hypothetical protein
LLSASSPADTGQAARWWTVLGAIGIPCSESTWQIGSIPKRSWWASM